ncbi:HNH endonuclease [Varibaculum cambriense]|uniref:HNH endonuclease n=1 Tax=Varibaculum cambriense TaxID=184870 RepID=UPI0037DDDAEA
MSFKTKPTARYRQLPKDWRRIRVEVIQRDHGRCQICGAPGTDVDHIVRGQDHSLSNLRLLCRRCHMRRTGRDGGRVKYRSRVCTLRPKEAHPGLKTSPAPKDSGGSIPSPPPSAIASRIGAEKLYGF